MTDATEWSVPALDLPPGTSTKFPLRWRGRRVEAFVVNFDGRDRVAVGDIARLTITEALPHSLRGALASQAEEAVCLSR